MAERFVTAEQERAIRRAHVITPSNVDPWFGSWADGEVFTQQQLFTLHNLGLDPTTVDRMDAKVKARNREWYVPTGSAMPTRAIPCPIVGNRAGRIRVVAPRGMINLIWPTGHVIRPKPERHRPIFKDLANG